MGEGMEKGTKGPPRSGGSRAATRYIFQVDSSADGTVLRILDTRSDRVFREIPIEDFLAYARCHRNVKPFLLGHLPV